MAAKAPWAISTLSLYASNLAYLSSSSKLVSEHSKLYTACPCYLLVQSVHRICPTGFVPFTAYDPIFRLCFMA